LAELKAQHTYNTHTFS